MNVKKFSASSSRDALRQVREALGPDAVILSNRNINGLVEILALASEDMSSLASPVVEKETLAAQVALPAQEATMLSAFAKRRMETDQAAGLAGALEQSQQARNARPPEPAPQISVLREMAEMMNELRSMRTMMESQFSELSWSSQQKREPVKATILRELLAAGFSASLSRYLVENLPAGGTAAAGMIWIKTVLARNITAVSDESAMLEQGGVFALVGPTGVGKTTTTAKLAARCVMRHGPGKLALITTDGYRIGGYEQLRIYGKILGVMVHSVKDESDLRIALDELKNKHTVLIDTVGVSQRDHMVTEQVAMLQGAGSRVKRLLCLNATSTGETLNEVVRAYQGSGLAGCVMTKLDEAATIGNVLDVVIRQKLNLFYVANGQRVPEDLHVANKQYLVDRAFKLKRESKPFQFTDAELPLVMAGTTRAVNDKTLREVHLG
ncbi:MAG: flagellar biosynthesis protein FlhF [Burkholderiaceae bacterium]|jgi:flagellar biosynthesis protein FlhF